MANARLEGHRRAWLVVRKTGQVGDRVVLAAEMFDGTPFEFSVPKHDYDDRGLVEVGFVGEVAGVHQIMLPEVTLQYGDTVRVKPAQLVGLAKYLEMGAP